MSGTVAVAKEADRKQEFSPTKSSDSGIQCLQDGAEMQLGSMRGVMGNIRRDGDKPSVESIATQLSGMHTTQRAPVLLGLQQTHGNRYVQRVVSGIQAKLKVGQPGDVYEQEADRVAEQVMRMPEPEVQRGGKPPEVQRRGHSTQSHEVSSDLESRIKRTRGGGQPLPENTRAFFEPRFGSNFSSVRIHTSAESNRLNRALSARAFTMGQDIHFRQGAYDPGSSTGRELLAHELTHVVQQEGAKRIYCNDDGESTPRICGPDITPVIITHLNEVVSQEQGDLSWIWMQGASELQGYARRNAPMIRSAADSVSGCPSNEDCAGAYTVGGHCISGYHIDHILIMCYIEASYGALTARSAGQYNESFWLGTLTEGFWFAGSSNAVSNADLTFNEIAICLGERMAHAEEAGEDVTDILTREEVQECFEGADMSVIGVKPTRTGSTAYRDCTPCSIPAPMPDLDIPPIDL